MTIKELGFSLIMLLCSCNQHKKKKQTVASEPLKQQIVEPKFDSSSFAVLPFEKQSDYLFKGAMPAALSATEIRKVEHLLQKAVDEHNKAQESDYQNMIKAFPNAPYGRKNYFINLPDYRRQLIAVLNPNGEKEVWVNCFCSDGDPYWRREVVMVDDGGNCFFNLKINLTKAIWYDMMVNGIA